MHRLAYFLVSALAISGLISPAAVDETRLPPLLVTAIARDLHLTAEQYMDRSLAVQRTVLMASPADTENPANPANSGNERLGGDPYAAVGDSKGLRCSFGFNGVDASGVAVNISAGHCDPRNTPGSMSEAFLLDGPAIGPRVGVFARSSADGHDYSIIRIDAEQQFRFRNNAIRVPAQIPLKITGTADPVLGAPVCTSGTTTGFTCGTITAVDQTIQVGDRTLTNAFTTNICALQGDSGGVLVTGTSALGIASASNVADLGVCDVARVVTLFAGRTPELYATPIRAILADNPGVSVRTS